METLRAVKVTDLKKIYEINSSVQAFPWTKKALEEEIESPNSKGWVADDGVNITGYVFIRVLDESSEIMTLGVSEKHQRTGVATALIRRILKEGRDITLEVSESNSGALTLYKKMGFKIFNRRQNYYSDGAAALCMKLNIANPQ